HDRDDHAVHERFRQLRIAQDRAIPPERKALPGRESAGVEAEHDQDYERRVQKRQGRRGIEAQKAVWGRLHFHISSFATRLRMRPANSSALANINASDAAEPKGQSRAVVNWFWMRLPSITVLPPPRRSGVRWAPRQGMKTSTDP